MGDDEIPEGTYWAPGRQQGEHQLTEWDPRLSEPERNTDLTADTPTQLPTGPLALTAVRAETSQAAVASEYTTSSQPPGPSRFMVSVNIRSATSGVALLKVQNVLLQNAGNSQARSGTSKMTPVNNVRKKGTLEPFWMNEG